MFGPLNGVRTALVIAAGIAALAAAIVGEWVMASLLAAGVAVHGIGWWYLWKQRPPVDQQ
jgi:ABC-type proline/glycine betaine transport system permease subunit